MFKRFRDFLNTKLRLSLTAFAFFLPFSIFAPPFAFSFREQAPSISTLLLVGIAITIPTTLFFWLLITLNSKYFTENSTLRNVLVLVLTGTFRGLLFFYMIEFMNIENPSPLVGRVLNSAYTVVFWVGLACLLVESNRRFKRRYQALLTQILVLKLRSGESPDPGYALMAQQIARMQLKIKKTIQDREPAQLDAEHAEVLAATLREEIENGLRPLSQRLWLQSIFNPPTTRILGIVSTSITELDYSFMLTAFLYAGANVINTTQSLGFLAGVVYGATSFIVFCLLEKLRAVSIKRFLEKKGFINIGFVFSIGLLIGILTNALFKYLDLDYSFAVAIFSAPSLPVLIIAVAGIKLTLQDRQTMVEVLSKKVLKIKTENFDAVTHGNAASYLHNSLQAELTALAIQLDALAENPDPARNLFVMEKLEALVSQSKSEDFDNFLETPQGRLDRVVNSWDGITKINLNIDPVIWQDPSRSSIVVSLVQEAVANAVRSGKANRVDVVSQYSIDSIFVTITDNGSATLSSERRGIGSQWIDRIAISDWKLEQTDSGRVLRVEI